MSLTSIQDEIERLSSAERAMLIDILWDSLDEERVKEIEARWAAESEERIDAVDRGELQTIDEPPPFEIFARLSGNEAVPVYVRCAYRTDVCRCHQDQGGSRHRLEIYLHLPPQLFESGIGSPASETSR